MTQTSSIYSHSWLGSLISPVHSWDYKLSSLMRDNTLSIIRFLAASVLFLIALPYSLPPNKNLVVCILLTSPLTLTRERFLCVPHVDHSSISLHHLLLAPCLANSHLSFKFQIRITKSRKLHLTAYHSLPRWIRYPVFLASRTV